LRYIIVNILYKGDKQNKQLLATVAIVAVCNDDHFFFVCQEVRRKNKIQTHKAFFLFQCYCHNFLGK